jgi:acyl-CoA reductase-like NAD-dependent aldehyde dehydrogenase
MNMMTELADVKRGAVLSAKMRVAGREVGGNRVIEVRNPYTNALVGTVPKASIDDIRGAFAAARAYRARLTRFERSEILNKASGLIRARAESISDLITAGFAL